MVNEPSLSFLRKIILSEIAVLVSGKNHETKFLEAITSRYFMMELGMHRSGLHCPIFALLTAIEIPADRLIFSNGSY